MWAIDSRSCISSAVFLPQTPQDGDNRSSFVRPLQICKQLPTRAMIHCLQSICQQLRRTETERWRQEKEEHHVKERPRELLTTNQPKPAWLSPWQTIPYIILISNGNLHNSVSASVVGTSLLLIRSAQDFHSLRMSTEGPFPWCDAWRWFIVNRFHYFYWVCGEKIAKDQHVLTIFELCGQLKMRWPSKLDWLSRGVNSFQMKGSVPKSSEPPCCLNSLVF